MVRWWLAGVLLLLAAPAFGDFDNETAYSYARLTVTSAAVTCLPAQERPAARVFVSTEGEVRYRYDGGSPTVDDGHVAPAGSSFALDGRRNVQQLCLIAVTADAAVSATFEYD